MIRFKCKRTTCSNKIEIEEDNFVVDQKTPVMCHACGKRIILSKNKAGQIVRHKPDSSQENSAPATAVEEPECEVGDDDTAATMPASNTSEHQSTESNHESPATADPQASSDGEHGATNHGFVQPDLSAERDWWTEKLKEEADLVRDDIRNEFSTALTKMKEAVKSNQEKLIRRAELETYNMWLKLGADLKEHEDELNAASKLARFGKKLGLPFAKDKEKDSLSDDEYQELGRMVAEAAVKETAIARLLGDLRVLEAREELLKDLPNLFDYVDAEIEACEKRIAASDPAAEEIMTVLRRMEGRMAAWMQRNELEAFPKVGEMYDGRDQEWLDEVPLTQELAGKGHQPEEVVSVDTRGYRFRDGDYPLRRALVVCYKASPNMETPVETPDTAEPDEPSDVNESSASDES